MSTIIHNDGEAIDCRGVPIYPGDLLKTFHFRDRRQRKHWLYHVVVRDGDVLRMVPTSHLEPSKRKGGGSCILHDTQAAIAEVIDGHGQGDCLDFNDRPKRTPQVTT